MKLSRNLSRALRLMGIDVRGQDSLEVSPRIQLTMPIDGLGKVNAEPELPTVNTIFIADVLFDPDVTEHGSIQLHSGPYGIWVYNMENHLTPGGSWNGRLHVVDEGSEYATPAGAALPVGARFGNPALTQHATVRTGGSVAALPANAVFFAAGFNIGGTLVILPNEPLFFMGPNRVLEVMGDNINDDMAAIMVWSERLRPDGLNV